MKGSGRSVFGSRGKTEYYSQLPTGECCEPIYRISHNVYPLAKRERGLEEPLNPSNHKFDPSKAAHLKAPERQGFLPDERVLELLELSGDEVVVDYGAGNGVLTVPLVRELQRGTVHAVEENPEMFERLRRTVAEAGLAPPEGVELHEIRENRIPLRDSLADRVLAVNLLHEVVGERALQEMSRLLAPGGWLLVVDWRGDVERPKGPPTEVSLTPAAAEEFLAGAGFEVRSIEESAFPYHFVLRADPR